MLSRKTGLTPSWRVAEARSSSVCVFTPKPVQPQQMPGSPVYSQPVCQFQYDAVLPVGQRSVLTPSEPTCARNAGVVSARFGPKTSWAFAPRTSAGSGREAPGTACSSGGRIANVRPTSAAGSQSPFPGCEALMVQLPRPLGVTVPAETLHGPLAASVGSSPELALTPSANGASPSSWSAAGGKSIDWAACATVRVALMSGAA